MNFPLILLDNLTYIINIFLFHILDTFSGEEKGGIIALFKIIFNRDYIFRFPLFGGWKTHYVVGYNVPSYEYLYYKG